MANGKREFDTQVVASFEAGKTSEVLFYYDFYRDKVWANIRKFIKSDRYTGPTGDGIKFEPALLADVIRAVKNAEQNFDSLSDQEFLRVPRNKLQDFVIHASTFKGTIGVDFRIWYKAKGGGGWTSQGIRFRTERLHEVLECLEKMVNTKIQLKELSLQTSLDFQEKPIKGTASLEINGIPERLKELFAEEEDDGNKND